jgi:AraC-like DNA-binding protein
LPGFYTIEVWDPRDLDERLSAKLRKPHDAHAYTLRDLAAQRGPIGKVLTRHRIRAAGDLQVNDVADRLGTKIIIGGDGIDCHCFSFVHTGAMSLDVPGHRGPVEAGEERGAIHRGRSGTRALTADETARTNLWIKTERLEAGLAAALDDLPKNPLDFVPVVNWSQGGGPGLLRLLRYIAAEFERPHGIASNPLALAAFTDLFIHTALRDLAHNHTERLKRGRHGAAPRHLRRAEDFMRTHAAEPLRMEQIATAAGCGVRSLHVAFRHFRDTTPHSALTAIRLERARDALHTEAMSVSGIAIKWGFTNVGRFAALYRRRYGETPTETRGKQ